MPVLFLLFNFQQPCLLKHSSPTHQPADWRWITAEQLHEFQCPLPFCLGAFFLFFFFFFCWLILFGWILSIKWLILKPQPPYFRVNALNVSNFSLSGVQIKENYDNEIFIRNPNKKLNLNLSNFDIWVSYRRIHLSPLSACLTGYLVRLSLCF